MERYVIDERVGEGNFGTVIKAQLLESGRHVAMKRVPIGRLSGGLPNNILREMKSMQHVNPHPNILQLYEVFPHSTCLVFVTELCDTDLAEVLASTSSRSPLPSNYVKSLILMLLRGLAHCHDRGILHRDVKPANLLLKGGVLKLGDFGLARPFKKDLSQELTHEVATRWYRAPELLLGCRRYGPSVDIWGAGCILSELLCGGSVLFSGVSDIDQLSRIFSVLGTPTPDVWPGVVDLPDWNKIVFPHLEPQNWEDVLPEADPLAISLLESMLHMDPSRRISAQDALCHPYFHHPPAPCPPLSMRLPTKPLGMVSATKLLSLDSVQRPQSPAELLWPSSPTSSRAPLLANYRGMVGCGTEGAGTLIFRHDDPNSADFERRSSEEDESGGGGERCVGVHPQHELLRNALQDKAVREQQRNKRGGEDELSSSDSDLQ